MLVALGKTTRREKSAGRSPYCRKSSDSPSPHSEDGGTAPPTPARLFDSLSLRHPYLLELLTAQLASAAERQDTVRNHLALHAASAIQTASSTQQDKARALWVRHWLRLSYTRSEPHTVPRQALYHSYTLSCQEYGIKPINSASFGKAVRAAYPGIKTRRLGVRGNSKYHYVSIRPAIQIEAERLNEYGDSSGAWHVAPEDGSMDFQADGRGDVEGGDIIEGGDIFEGGDTIKGGDTIEGGDMDESDEEDYHFGLLKTTISFNTNSCQGQARNRSTSITAPYPQRPPGAFLRRHTTASVSSASNHPLHVHDTLPVYSLAAFPTLASTAELGLEISSTEHLQTFWNQFCQHQDILVGCIRGHHFERYEILCRTFWASLAHPLVQVCSHPVISNMVSDALATTYDHIVGVLLNKLIAPFPAASQSSLRHLADNLESITKDCLAAFPREFQQGKIELSARAAHLFIRFIDLHQLSAALSPILSNQSQLRTMLNAWDNLDVRNVTDHCALTCHCQQHVIETVLRSCRTWLLETEAAAAKGGHAIERLGMWVDKMLSDVVRGDSLNDLVVTVGFVTSQVMRDFTLKSDQSFGLFQLLKTWVDDWVSMAALRKTKVPTSTVCSTSANAFLGSGAPPMTSVYIPAHNVLEDQLDLATAVPFTQSFSQWPQQSAGLYGHQNTQILSIPAFGHDHHAATPLPPFPGDNYR